MNRSVFVAVLFVVSSSAASAGAVHFAVSPYRGSDLELNIQNQAIESAGLGDTGWTPTSVTSDYVGGGSGAGESAMATGAQQTAPMSRLPKGGASKNACAFTSSLANASGEVIGIDAARIFASAAVVNAQQAANGASGGGATNAANACNSSATGLAYDSANNPALAALAVPLTFTNWRDVLALLYGGLDRATGVTDCNSVKRQELVGNWSLLFENGGVTNGTAGRCASGATCTAAGAACADGSTCYTGLTHAWRQDDSAGTTDVFSNLIGLQGAVTDPFGNKFAAGFAVSSSAVKSFGTSPYCNALNWDPVEASSNPARCGNATDLHYVGPGGLPLPASVDPLCQTGSTSTATLCHHVPPFQADASGQALARTYGSVPTGTQSFVFPTSFQDNDPIRVPCLGQGLANRVGEDVCNADRRLGVVLTIPSLNFVPNQNPGSLAYVAGPAAATTCQNAGAGLACGGSFIFASPPQVPTCAPRGLSANGLCPNNDQPLGVGCAVPVGTATATNAQAQCAATQGTPIPCETAFPGVGANGVQSQCGLVNGAGTGSTTDGRVFNLHVRKEPCVDGSCSYVSATVGGVALNMTGGFARIHEREVAVSGTQVCQLEDATQQIGCLTQADPLSVGLAGNTGDVWESSDPLAKAGRASTCTGTSEGLRVHTFAAGTACTPSKNTATAYPLWRKLYLNSLVGFANITTAPGPDGQHPAEQELAEWEGVAANMDPVMLQFAEFPLPFSPAGNDGSGNPNVFCEDFNEYLNGCGSTGTVTTGPGNTNGCANNAGATSAFGAVPSDPSSNPVASSTSTVCGNGVIEDYEDCDPGTPANGSAAPIAPAGLPAGCGTCSTVCRCSNF